MDTEKSKAGHFAKKVKHGFGKPTHGYCVNGKKIKEYYAWMNIKMRCYNKNNERNRDYGARGIKMCDRWLESFTNFISDLGYAPSPKHTVERINNDGDYEPMNCRWATYKEQRANCRPFTQILYKGEIKTPLEWHKILGVKYATIMQRARKGEDIGANKIYRFPNMNPNIFPSELVKRRINAKRKKESTHGN